ncbi:MAG TPA: ABC transporter substrate-binding protein [Bacillota bacterium]|nr:ABC transporter substrate-binding protein [Bacillota bacterium]
MQLFNKIIFKSGIKTNREMFSLIFIFVLALGTVVSPFVACTFAKEGKLKEKNVTIRILDSTTPSDWEIIKKAIGRDILKEEGVQLELISSASSASGGTISIQALLANNIDYASSAWPAWINAIAGGGKIKAVTTGSTTSKDYPGNGLVVLENSSIHTVKDLVGKRIAVNVLGASADYEIRQYLKQNGISIDQVQLVVVPSPQIEQTLRTKQVDVAAWTMGGGVEYEMAMDRGGLRELPGTKRYDIRGNTIAMGNGFRKDFIKRHPETVQRFVRVVEKSKRILWDEFQKDPEQVRKAYAEVTESKGGNPKLFQYYRPSAFSPDYPFASDKDIQWWIDILESEGKLKGKQIKPSSIYTNEFNPYYKK